MHLEEVYVLGGNLAHDVRRLQTRWQKVAEILLDESQSIKLKIRSSEYCEGNDMDKRQVLQNITFGERIAEDEVDELSSYFVETNQWQSIFAGEVDVVYGAKGSNRPHAFKWIVTQTQDGSSQTAPRELIHLLACAQKSQLQRLEVGGNEPQDEALFEALALKNALPEVSRTRYQQTLLAEFPKSRKWLEKLDGQKTEQTAETLATLWKVNRDEAIVYAKELVEIGFFKERRSKKGESTFWVPYLYRDALRMIQGSAK